MKYFIILVTLLFATAFWLYSKNQNDLKEVANIDTQRSSETPLLKPSEKNLKVMSQTKNAEFSKENNNLVPVNKESSNVDTSTENAEYPLEGIDYASNMDVGPNEIYSGTDAIEVNEENNNRAPANEIGNNYE